ncbi:MAG: zinc ribbon domain-containing protein [Lachnospiraceae bacterium]|nr:zinc ribbon domain-containing protein [Lachnospiraceae bacterium]
MNCPNCGSEFPEGSVMCPVCGNPVASNPTAGYNQPAPAPSYVEPTPIKTKKSSPIVSIVIAVVAVAAIFLLGFFVLGGRYMGTYKITSVNITGEAYGQVIDETYSASDLSALGLEDMALKVTFNNRCRFLNAESYGLTGPYKFKVSGDKVTITGSDGSVYGKYENGKISISEEEDGLEVTFFFEK